MAQIVDKKAPAFAGAIDTEPVNFLDPYGQATGGLWLM